MPIGAYYLNDFLSHEDEVKVEDSYELFLSTHVGRSATVLLCLITELQVHCRFEGHNINDRICKIWEALMPLFEAKDLYQGRYAERMKENGIVAAA